MSKPRFRSWFALLLPLMVLVTLITWIELLEPVLTYFNHNDAPAIYYRDTFANLVFWHMLIVFLAIGLATIVALLCGIFVTRDFGRDFLPLARALANLGQTFPPVAVLALAIPSLGFGLKPTLVALFLYGLLPIFENTVTGSSKRLKVF